MKDQQKVSLGFYGYRRKEVEPLAEAIRYHSVSVRTARLQVGGGGFFGEALVIISIGLAIGLGEMCKQFFNQAYDAWLRQPLADTLFRPREGVARRPRLELTGTDLTAIIEPRTVSDIDDALKVLPAALDALERSNLWQRIGRPISPSLSYRDGEWIVHGISAVYRYHAGTDEYVEVPHD